MLGMQHVAGGWRWFGLSALLGAWSCSGADFVEGHIDEGGAAGDGNGLGGEPSKSDGGTANEAGSGSKVGGVSGSDEGGAHPDVGGGGGDENATGLSVVSVTPADDAIAVAREGVVDVVFSAPVDKETVTATSFQVEGPLGGVEGKLVVAGNTVTFTPDRPLSLLANFTVTLSSAIRSSAGAALSKYVLTFQTRDGVFGKPKRVTTVSGMNLSIQGNRLGHVALIWNDRLTPSNTEAAVFDPARGTWGAPAPVEADANNEYSPACLGLNESGEAFAVMSSTVAAWNRFDGLTWGAASTNGVGERRWCALADDGSAMTTGTDASGKAVASLLSPNNTWSATTTLRAAAMSHDVARFGGGFLALFEVVAEKAIYSRVYDPSIGWLPAAQVTGKNSTPNYWSLAASESSAMFTWLDASGAAKAAIFDGASWSTEVLGPGSAGTHARVGQRGHLAAWFNQGNAYAARYDLTTGWEDPIKLGSSDGEVFGPGAEVDPSGNGIAAWGDGGSVVWRRRAQAGAEWSAPQQIKDQDPSGLVLSRADDWGNVMLVWENALGIWATRFE